METHDIIKKIRSEKNLTQVEFAEKLGISRSALTQLEAGNTKPSFDVLKILSEEFGVDVSTIFAASDGGGRTKKHLVSQKTQHDVAVILNFYQTHYGIHYNEIMEDRMIEQFIKVQQRIGKGEKLDEVYRIYRSLKRITEKLERDIIDPFKRHWNTLNEMKKFESATASEDEKKEIEEKMKDLDRNLQIIFRDSAFFLDYYGSYFSDLPEFLTQKQIEMGRKESEHQKIMKYSQEKYLNAFYYLLHHVGELKLVEEYFDVESMWRE
ncbi:helix-turn-helix domain-containing protein [Kaistella sp.]|uniref:helix-turn-helix domain-containing protein n=1 Tax=Kaistella sp. TaxID=2782235 RepID=UPI002F95275D